MVARGQRIGIPLPRRRATWCAPKTGLGPATITIGSKPTWTSCRRRDFDCYRFSTSWARVLPEGRGAPNDEGLDFYDRLTDAMLARKIKPCLTLYHWELPAALADLGGWTNPDIALWFAEYAQVVMDRIGDRMHSTATINEPWCVAWMGHFLGQHAPGLSDIRATARAMHHVLLAHGTATQAMRAAGMKNLGAVFNMEWAEPADDTPEAARAAQTYDGYYNRFYLDGVFRGRYPDTVLAGMEQHLPKGWQDDFAVIGAPVDWCGLNYYTRKIIAPEDGPWPSLREVEGPLPKTFMGWEIHPEGLYRFLKRTAQEYTGDVAPHRDRKRARRAGRSGKRQGERSGSRRFHRQSSGGGQARDRRRRAGAWLLHLVAAGQLRMGARV